MNAVRKCPQCGAEQPSDALEGLCQDCLGRAALADSVAQAFSLAGSGGVPAASGRNAGPEGPSNPQPGTAALRRFGDYELLGEIARGGMGVVYKARHVPLNRTVAVKMITAGQFASKEFVHRFRVEASAAAVLQHPNIVAVHEVGVHDGHHFFSMDYVAGKNLAQIVRDGPLPASRAARYVQQIAEAIHYAHESGILHRDLKPSNVIIGANDQPRITDFGLAKQLDSDSAVTLTGDVMGTPGYMPPEQASGNRGAVKAWSDVYSIGAILYHLLTGRAPFAAGSTEATLNQVLHQDPVSVRLLNPAVPRDLNTICLKCLEKEPSKRYATAQLLTDELTRFLKHEPILAHPITPVGKVWRWCRRKPALAATGAVALLAVVLGFAGVLWQWRNSEGNRRLAERNAAQAQATVTRLEIDRAEMLFDTGQSSEALAYLARVLRREPTNRVAGERIVSALAQRNFCVPLFRLEHKTNVTSAEFSPDGERVLTASKDGKARIWDGRTGQPLLESFQHAGEVSAAHFSPDGARVVTVSLDKTARLWDAQTGRAVTEPLKHESGVLCADFSPDGQRVVTGSEDGSMRAWNAVTGAPLGTNTTFEERVDFVKFSLNGKWIVLGTRVGTGRILNAADWTELASFNQRVSGSAVTFPSFSPDGSRVITVPRPGLLDIIGTGDASTNRITRPTRNASITGARFSPDGQTVATSMSDSTARIWDAGTLQPVGELIRHESLVNAIEFSPDGERVVTGSKDHTARIWESRTGQPLSEPLRHGANVLSVQFSADGQRILSRCEGPGVWVWQVRGGQPLTAALQHPHPVRRAVFSPEGQRVATMTRVPGIVNVLRLWDARRAIPLLPPFGNGWSDVQFSRDGRMVLAIDNHGASTNHQGITTVWDARTGKVIGGPFFETNAVECARFSPDGQLVVTAGNGDRVNLWRIATGDRVREFPHQATAGFAAFSPDGRWVITTSEDKTARLWDWRTGKPLMEPLHHGGAVVWADVSADSQRVVTLSRDQTARIWEASSGNLLHTLPHAEEPYNFNSVQFSLDGRLVVIASGNTAQIWDSHTGQPVTAPLKHDGRVNSVRFSPDGKRLVTSCLDNSARIWDVATGHLLSEPLRHRARVMYAEFSPDGRWVITASDDGTAKIWEVPTLTSSVPLWLADWAEAVAGQRIDERNANQSVSFDEVRRLRQSLAQVPDVDEAGRWAKWFFAENTTRKISPASLLTAPQLVEQRIEQSTLDSLQQAVRLSPTNGVAQGRLALVTLTNEMTPAPRLVASLEWQSRRSLELSPNEPDAWWARAQFCEHLGRSPEVLGAMDRAIRLGPTNANFWNRMGWLLEKTNRLEEAYKAYSQALSFAGSNWAFLKVRSDVLLRRSDLLRRLNRRIESNADYEKLLETELTATECEKLAWQLATGPPEGRDPERAVLLAEKAVRLAPQDGPTRNTLGVAYYRAGQYGKAVENLLEAGKIDPEGPNAFDLFFLAMSHQQLRETEKARAFFQKALQWWRDHPAFGTANTNEELKSFQAEAEALLSEEKRP